MSGVRTNIERARDSWGQVPPRWVVALAAACDRSGQREVGEVLGKSSGYVSRLVNNRYPGDLAEAERLVLARLAGDRVQCPATMGTIALTTCMRTRRRAAQPVNPMQRHFARHCPACPRNTDTNPDSAVGQKDD